MTQLDGTVPLMLKTKGRGGKSAVAEGCAERKLRHHGHGSKFLSLLHDWRKPEWLTREESHLVGSDLKSRHTLPKVFEFLQGSLPVSRFGILGGPIGATDDEKVDEDNDDDDDEDEDCGPG